MAPVRLRVSNVSMNYLAIRYMTYAYCFLFIRSTVKGCRSLNDLLNYAVSVLGILPDVLSSDSPELQRKGQEILGRRLRVDFHALVHFSTHSRGFSSKFEHEAVC
jgi:hypothetical protein